MESKFVYPEIREEVDIRGNVKRNAVAEVEDATTSLVLDESPIDKLIVSLPPNGTRVAISSMVKIWSVVFDSDDQIIKPNMNLELNIGNSIELVRVEGMFWVIVRSF